MAWHRCNVVRAGPADDDEVYIMLSDAGNAFSNRYFKALAGKRREMLAVALSAISTGYPVDASLPEPPDEYGTITRLYVSRV